MHKYLDAHPDIAMSSRKENHFFSIEELWERGPDFHNSLFESQGTAKYYGESSTTYAAYPKALERIKDCLLSPKLIVLLREPIDRIISHYRWLCALDIEKDSFHDAFMKDLKVPFDPNVSIRGCYRGYRRFSNYSVYVPLMFSLFGKENVHLVRTEQLKRNPQKVVNQCFRFLGLRPKDHIQEMRLNQTQDKNPLRLSKVLGKYKYFIPEILRKEVKKLLVKLDTFSGLMLFHEKPAPLEISPDEESMLSDILSEDISYYEDIFTQQGTS